MASCSTVMAENPGPGKWPRNRRFSRRPRLRIRGGAPRLRRSAHHDCGAGRHIASRGTFLGDEDGGHTPGGYVVSHAFRPLVLAPVRLIFADTLGKDAAMSTLKPLQ